MLSKAGSRVSFPGCIRNVTVNKFAIGPPSTPFKIQNCYANAVERGVSFEQGGGYLLVGQSAYYFLKRSFSRNILKDKTQLVDSYNDFL